jgi:hypothetical protein
MYGWIQVDRSGLSGVLPSSTCFGPAAAPLHLQGTSAASCCTQVRASRQTGARSNSQQGSCCTESDTHTHRRHSQQAGCCTGPATATPQPQPQSHHSHSHSHRHQAQTTTRRQAASEQRLNVSNAAQQEGSERLNVQAITLHLHTAAIHTATACSVNCMPPPSALHTVSALHITLRPACPHAPEGQVTAAISKRQLHCITTPAQRSKQQPRKMKTTGRLAPADRCPIC